MPRYEVLAKLCLLVSIILFFISYCFGCHESVGLIGFGFLLASGGFEAVRGKFKAGYLYASALIIVGMLQFLAHCPALYAGLSIALGFVFAILQTIELCFPNKKILE